MEGDYKKLYEGLLDDKKKMELDFGQKRAQFRQLYLDCEEKLNKEKTTSKELEIQINDLSMQISKLKEDNDNIQAAAQITQESNLEEFQNLRLKHKDEIASLRHIWEETNKDNRMQSKLSKQEQHSPGRGAESPEPSFLSMMKNVFTNPKPLTKTSSDKISKEQEDLNLEDAQMRAQLDVDAWKQIVAESENAQINLRKELEQTKDELRKAEQKINEFIQEKQQPVQTKDEKLNEVKKYLDSERSARTDLEMYVAVLNTQKGVLTEDSDKLRRELHNVCRLFEQEKANHNELKQTWALANEQFLYQQNKLIFELDTSKNLLTSHQLEQLSKVMREESNIFEPQPPPDVGSLGYSENLKTSNASSAGSLNLIQLDTTDGAGKRSKKKKSNSSILSNKSTVSKESMQAQESNFSDSVFSTIFPAAYHAKKFNEMLQESHDKNNSTLDGKPLYLSSSSDDTEDSEDEDDLERAIAKQNIQRRYNVEQATEASDDPINETNEKSVLRKSNSSNDILLNPQQKLGKLQEKSLSQGDVSSTNLAAKVPTSNIDINSQWSSAGQDYGPACIMCQNYEKQLQRLQKEFMTVTEKEDQLIDTIKSLEGHVDSEKQKVISLEKSISNLATDTKSQLSIHNTNQVEVDKQVKLLFDQVHQFQMDIQNELRELSESRDRAFAEKTSLKEQLDEMKDKSFDAVQLPPDYEEFKLKANAAEQKLKNDIMFLKDQMVAEKFDRESMETVLQQDLHNARSHIAHLKHQMLDQQNVSNSTTTTEDLLS